MLQLNMTVHTVLVESVSITTPAATQARTYSGIPISILWLPYVIFSLLIITLILVSFIRFHIKNGHKYKRRRAELWKRLNVNKMQDFLNQIQTQVSGAMPSPPNGSTNTIEVTLSPTTSNVSSYQANPHKKRKKKRPKLSYTSNDNGSMVDVRVTGAYSDTFNRSSSGSSIFTLSMGGGPPRKIINLTNKPLSIEAPEDEILLIEETL